MNKKVVFLILIIFSLILAGCKSNTQTANSMDANMQIERRIKEIETEKELLRHENSRLINENNALKEQIKSYENWQKEKDLLECELLYCSYLPQVYKNNNDNIFHPSLIKTGDKIKGLAVSNIISNNFAKEVIFTGEFKVKLKVSQDQNYEDKEYIFEVTGEYNDKVAKDIFTYSKNIPMQYNLGTSSKELIKSIGNRYHDGMKVTVILNNYSISYDMSDFVNRANFIKLVSID